MKMFENDITFCMKESCPKFKECRRSEHPKEGRHSYSYFESCDGDNNFMPKKNKGGESNEKQDKIDNA